ncbi:MAG TPA: hypothetical protein VKB23_08120 [Solirubrobacterales bacterium]|nr:hypothetical protein [Solirubrobacterales bacterium]
MQVQALDSDDLRIIRLRVAGIAALFVAKAHKIGDRVESGRPDRLADKDAADVLRLMQTSSPAAVAATLRELLEHPTAHASTKNGVDRLHQLFGNRAAPGIEMATRALRKAMPADRVRAICLSYTENLDGFIRPIAPPGA